ncbi:MAG: universal stress protein [Verrucomicrobiales bacterium]|nr:universal stress protein [Verrucomicrobiales bacterium]
MKETIKRILVPIDPTVYSQAATESACRIARHHNAGVSGVAVLDSDEIRSSLVPAVGPYYPGVMESVMKKKHHADQILKECLDRFAATCDKMGVTHFESEYEGIPARKLLESAIFHDLMVVGIKTSFHFETRKESIEGFDTLLDRTITPIIAVPARGLEKVDSVLVTMDGSLGSARALQDFSRFIQPYQAKIKIVVAGKKKEEADFLLKNSGDFLRSHGITQIETEAVDAEIKDYVDAELKNDVDMVVAGIHSKKLLKDMFVGSFTKSLFERGDVSLFLSH